MIESYAEAWLPFRDDLDLRADYTSIFGEVRFGKVLEDLDAMAATIAYLHCEPFPQSQTTASVDPPMIILTAAVDRIELRRALPANVNVKLRGMVTWVGHSSMEVTLAIDLDDQPDRPPAGAGGDDAFSTADGREAATAKFIMVARSRDGARAMPINRLALETEQDRTLFGAGQAAAAARKARQQASLYAQPPTAAESALLHQLLLHPSPPAVPHTPMAETVLRTVRVCHPQERNLHDLMFGGILMREAFELAFAAASLYCRGRPVFQAIDQLSFVHPVPIGSILEFAASIVYTRETADRTATQIHVEVVADVISVQSGARVTTNTFHLTYLVGDADGPRPAPVRPRSYVEAVRYIEGMRRLQNPTPAIPRPDPVA